MVLLPIKNFSSQEKSTCLPRAGFVLIEVMLALSLFSLFSLGIFYLTLNTAQRNAKTQLQNEALFYAEEGMEAVRWMRDKDYLALNAGEYGLNFTEGEWRFVAAPDTSDEFFERTVTVEDVYRDENGNIAQAGVYDLETKKIISSVTWRWHSILPQSVRLETYLSDWRGDEWIQTTCTEFESGEFENTESNPTASPPLDNCSVQLSELYGESDFFQSTDIGNHGNDVVADGDYAYVATSKENSGVTIVDVSDPEAPEVVASVNIGGKGRSLFKEGNTLYVGVANENKGLAIIDVQNPSTPLLLANVDIGNWGNQPAVSGDTVFMAVESSSQGLVSIDVSDKYHPILLDTLSLGEAKGKTIHLSGTYAYMGTDSGSNGLRVIDSSNPFDLASVSTLDVGEEINGIEIMGNYAFLGTKNEAQSLQVINIANPATPSIVAWLNVNGKIQDLVLFENFLYAAMDESDEGLAMVEVSNPLAPQWLNNVDISGKGTGIATNGSEIFISIDINNQGLVLKRTMITTVATAGSFISNEFDTGGEDTRYNFLDWDQTGVPGGGIALQIRTADSVAHLETAKWVEVNPLTPIVLDPLRTGQRYFQFKVLFTSDGISSPILNQVRVNYTP
ncbi:MAG: hypothetical protein ACD_28C00300G0005 [uncultured bacterium]|nr:MAG: hypothetical protein ACD_28C00300G0005 [uncultured bacterium]